VRTNPCLVAVLDELERAGVRDYTVENDRGRRHIHVRWRSNGTARLVVVTRTPGGSVAPLNARGDVRRLLRLDGLITRRNGDERGSWCERP
jgi:hypothetical protein